MYVCTLSVAYLCNKISQFLCVCVCVCVEPSSENELGLFTFRKYRHKFILRLMDLQVDPQY